MEKPLWAPWRMEYILGKKSPGCIFCAMVAGEPSTFRASLVLVVQPHAFVCLNLYPFASSHLLVAPRKHVGDLRELSDEEYGAFAALLRQSVACVEDALKPGGVNVGLNLGQAAGAGIADHVHGHVVPRWEGDTNFMPVVANVRVMPEHLDASWARLYPFFADLPGVRAPPP